MHKPESVQENEMQKIHQDFEIQTDQLIPASRPDLVITKKKKKQENMRNSELCRPGGPQRKNMENKKRDKYLDFARELKKLYNMKVMVIPAVVGVLGTILSGLVKKMEELEIGGRADAIQTTALLRSARILEKVLETWGDLQSFVLQWKTIC